MLKLVIGTCYLEGVGVSKDLQEAFKLFGRAAKAGHTEAIFCLHLMLSAGHGIYLFFSCI